MKKIKVYGHRGSMGTFPENTLTGFQKAIESGVDGLEIDVHMTKDGEIVIIHDETLARTTNGTGYIKDLTLEEIKQYHIVNHSEKQNFYLEQVPTLEELLQLLEPYEQIDLNIELKTYIIPYIGIEEKIISLLKKYQKNREIIFSSFHLPTLRRIKMLDHSAKIALLLNRLISHPNDYIKTFQLEGLHIEKNLLLAGSTMFEDCNNLRVWTANRDKDIEQLLALNIDAIITDFPEKVIVMRDKQSYIK